MTIFGIDVASHQGPGFNFNNVQGLPGGKPSFAIIKASGGHGYRNEYLDSQVRNARASGVEVGFYHYMFEPTAGGGDVNREVSNFIEACRPYVQVGTTFWLDVEESPAKVGFTGNLGDWIITFCEAVEAEYGCVCGIYCATWYLRPTSLDRDERLTKYPFWIASWQDTPPANPFLEPWEEITVWQYNASGVDKNRFEGTLDQFRSLGVPQEAPPQVLTPNAVIPFIMEDGTPAVTIVFQGQAKAILGVDVADLGISVVGMNDLIHDQSIQENHFEGWRIR